MGLLRRRFRAIARGAAGAGAAPRPALLGPAARSRRRYGTATRRHLDLTSVQRSERPEVSQRGLACWRA